MSASPQILQDHTNEGWVGYSDFGAAGDGVTDDLQAIVDTHAYANEHNLSVRADDRATYYIGAGASTAMVQTSTTFGTARFVIDDTAVADREAPVFEVRSKLEPVSFERTALRTITQLSRGQQSLPVTLPSPCLIIAADDQVRHFIRWGANQNDGAPQKDVFSISPDGAVDPADPIVWDFERISSLVALPIDSEVLRITGGRFTTIANRAESQYTYYDRNIVVRRSNVVVEGLSHNITGEQDHGAPYAGFLKIAQCANVTVKDCRFTGHRTYSTIGAAGVPVSMGSYDISVADALDVSFVNCEQTNDINDTTYWGLFGSNYCKNILLDGCTFSRFDAHQGVYNVTIRNSNLGHMGIHAIGEGTITVENTRVLGKSFIHLRPDYGSTWHGDVVVRNCSFQPRAGQPSTCVLIEGVNLGQHDFGYHCSMPERITIDGLEIDDSCHPTDDPGPAIFADFNPDRTDDSYHDQYPYVITKEVLLNDVTTSSGRQLRLSDNPYMFRDVKITRVSGRACDVG
jgi:hypothetical protein